mmetsp:Transcript_3891/g.16695  ORF Transcript_3891/g.16695 Transcript_3891/m.16695 type:complete len:82 (+) Transcript_3891:384-629(+)
MGNILFLSGVTLVIGPQRSVTFFFQKKKLKGSIVFFVGIALVLISELANPTRRVSNSMWLTIRLSSSECLNSFPLCFQNGP